MLGKQHTVFKCKLLGLLFLFFNGVCTAAPVIKATSEVYKQAVSLRLTQNPNAAQSEEESHFATSYVIQLTHLSFKRQHADRLYHTDSNSHAVLSDVHWLTSYIPSANFLPRPAYYAFLFRYKLF